MQANGGSGEVPFRPTLMVMEQGEHNSLDHNAGQFNCKHYLSENLTFEGRLPLLLEFTIVGAPLVCHSFSSILLTFMLCRLTSRQEYQEAEIDFYSHIGLGSHAWGC
jgi:hypothetical protein